MFSLHSWWASPRSNQTFLLFLCLLFVSQYLLFENGKIKTATNYRIKSGSLLANGLTVAQRLKGTNSNTGPLPQAEDDPGAAYVLGTIWAVAYPDIHKEVSIPEIYFFIISLPYLLFQILMNFSLSHLIGKGAGAFFVLLIACSRLGPFLAFSGDVYYFPMLSLAIALTWLTWILRNPRHWAAAGLFAGTAWFISGQFRSYGVIVLAPAISAFILAKFLFPHTPGRARASAIFAILTFLALQHLYARQQAHPVWRPIHAGLFEFGGWASQTKKEASPNFVNLEEIPPESAPINGWNDAIEDAMIKRAFPKYRESGISEYRPEYEQLFRADILRLAHKYPTAFFKIFLKRGWRLLSVNPWPKMKDDSLILPAEPWESLIRSAFIFSVLIALGGGIWRQPKFWFFGSLLAFGAPSLLVHSGYLTYNVPLTSALVLFWLYCLLFLRRKSYNLGSPCAFRS